jgi:hypothetical protein
MHMVVLLQRMLDNYHAVLRAALERNRQVNCSDCNYDTHRCKGCGEVTVHGVYACIECMGRK